MQLKTPRSLFTDEMDESMVWVLQHYEHANSGHIMHENN